MSAKIITDISRVKPDVSARVWDLYVDHNIYGLTGGALAPGPPNTFLRTTNLSTVAWNPFSLSFIPEGVTGTVLRSGVTGGTGSIHWGYIDNTDIDPGLPNQLLQTNPAGNSVEWTSNVQVPGTLGVTGASTFTGNGLFENDLAVVNDLNVNNGDLSVNNGELLVLVGDSTLQSVDVNGNLSFNSVSGVTGNVLIKTSPTTQNWGNITASLISPGSNNQALMTRSGNVTFSNIIASDITAGTNLSVLTSAGGISQWLVPTPVNRIVFGTTFSAQDLNAAVGPVAANFSTLAFMNVATSTGSPIVGITQPSGTQFTIGTLGNYLCNINGYIDPTSTGLGNSILSLSVEVGGSESQRTCVVCNGNYSFSGSISFLAAAGQVVRILLRRVVGTGTLNTFAEGSGLPNYSSTIMFSLL